MTSLTSWLVFCTQEKKRRRNEEEETPEKRPRAPSPTGLDEEELCTDHTAVCSTKVCGKEGDPKLMVTWVFSISA